MAGVRGMKESRPLSSLPSLSSLSPFSRRRNVATLQVEIVTGERVVHQDDGVDMVVAPGADGTLGILPRHAPLFSLLKSGVLRFKKGGNEDPFVVFGGFIQVTGEKVVIMADTAEHVEEIDVEHAEEARRHAGEDLADADAALRHAALRLHVGQQRRRSRGPAMPTGGSNQS